MRCHCGRFGVSPNATVRDSNRGLHTTDRCEFTGSSTQPVDPNPTVTVTPPATLSDWWVRQAEAEAAKLEPKAKEYGSYDLQFVGRMLADMFGREYDTPEQMEAGILFYLIGKIARLASAAHDGHRASDDTFVDIAIYARMVLYIREHGRWP